MLHMETGRKKMADTACVMYTPAGYEKHAKQRYPGSIVESWWESECVWIHQGKSPTWLDWLTQRGKNDWK